MTSCYDDDRFDPQDDGRVSAPGADPDCRYCGGSGYVTDWVPYGSTNVPMRTGCECVEDPDDDGQPSDLQEQQDFAHDDDPPWDLAEWNATNE